MTVGVKSARILTSSIGKKEGKGECLDTKLYAGKELIVVISK